MIDASLAALALLLPDKALEHFDITDAKLLDGEIQITLTEKNTPPVRGKPVRFHSYRDISVSDFPIRGKPSVITFRRRYWKVDGEKELCANDIPIVFPGTKLEKAFAAFLKASGGDTTSILGEYRHFKSTGDQSI
ncbi:MAG: hypothetical protein Q8R25_01200 [bacterium]|nr:hypothetical protein [bacterium]